MVRTRDQGTPTESKAKSLGKRKQRASERDSSRLQVTALRLRLLRDSRSLHSPTPRTARRCGVDAPDLRWAQAAARGLRASPSHGGKGKECAAREATGPRPPGDGAAKDRVGPNVQPARDSQPRLPPEPLAAHCVCVQREAGTPRVGVGLPAGVANWSPRRTRGQQLLPNGDERQNSGRPTLGARPQSWV